MPQPQYLLDRSPTPNLFNVENGENLCLCWESNPSHPPISLANQYGDWDTWALNNIGMSIKMLVHLVQV
jgi:hypothetical protein